MLKNITQDRVRELFKYTIDGKLIWKITTTNSVKKGSEAGCANHRGYCRLSIDGTQYLTHRIIFLWHHGYMPENDIDHINRIKSDNRIENLREITRSCNMRNTGNPSDNTSGVKGITRDVTTGRYRVRVLRHELGIFENYDEAVLHRLAAEQCLNWSGCDSSSPAYKYALDNGLINPRRE